ncbi:MAG TPA: DUF3300 domain-containing protein [Planctomycetota bacterium]
MKATTAAITALLCVVSVSGRRLPASSSVDSEIQQTPPATEPKPQAPAATDPKAQAPAADPKQAPAKTETTFKPEQLEQIVAPIALHPDSLLAQILMASTYPLEIVEAYRWLEKNPSLKGTQLEEALKKQDWDASVKALCGLRDVVKQMNDNLDWTQDLGDAFLGQKDELMQTVQKMRKKALEAGNLKTTEQQKVTQDSEVIIIEQTKTEVVYVPSYSPTVVYGPSWYYPTYYYPPMYVAPAPGYGFMAFTAGVVWGAAIWGGCHWGGHGHCDVNINVNKYNNFNRNTNINGGRDNLPGSGNSSFKHNPSHRKGVNYKSPHTAQQFGGAQGSNRVTKDQARGFDRSASGSRPSAGTGNRAGATAPRAGNQPAGGAASRPSTSKPSTKSGSSALSGSRNPSADRSASSRGAASRSSSGSRSSGGSRGGGGARGGGGGRSGGGGRR